MSDIVNIYSACGHLLAKATPIELNTFHGIPLDDNNILYGLKELLVDSNISNGIDILPIRDPIEGWEYLHEVDIGALFVWKVQKNVIHNGSENSNLNNINSKTPFSDSSINAFNEWILKNPSKMIFSFERYQKIKYHLLNPNEIIKDSKERSFKHRVLKSYVLNDEKIFYKSSENKELQIVKESELFDLIKSIHCNLGHIGINKTWNALNNNYHGITKSHVTEILKECSVCATLAISKSVPPLKPIISSRIFERIQIDLVDMRSTPDSYAVPGKMFNWILHIKDHFSKFSSLYALETKQAIGVSSKLGEWIGMFGAPEILQCDNGREFKGIIKINFL